jgi:hypothetical protein
MNKFSHLMKETKSSAHRSAITTASPGKKARGGMPQFASAQSPKKPSKEPQVAKSPSSKVQFVGGSTDSREIINLRSTPTKDDELLPEQIMETIEGVAGEVVMGSTEDRVLGYPASFDGEEELKKGESGMASSDSSEGVGQHADDKPITQTLDLEAVKIVEQEELRQMSVSNRGEPFETELKSIFGRINLRAQELKSRFTNPGSNTIEVDREHMRDSLTLTEDLTGSGDPLRDLGIDLVSDEHAPAQVVDEEASGLDQTIVIGDIEASTIFDQEQSPGREPRPNEASIAASDLEELVGTLKCKHRAELDAMVLEQGSYKRVIKGLVKKVKQQSRALEEKDREILRLRKLKAQNHQLSEVQSRLQADLAFYRTQCDKFKIALIEYDRQVNSKVILESEYTIAQLEVENANLRRLLNIPDELFKVDPEEEKKKAADKQKNVLKNLDERLKAAERKIQKK